MILSDKSCCCNIHFTCNLGYGKEYIVSQIKQSSQSEKKILPSVINFNACVQDIAPRRGPTKSGSSSYEETRVKFCVLLG